MYCSTTEDNAWSYYEKLPLNRKAETLNETREDGTDHSDAAKYEIVENQKQVIIFSVKDEAGALTKVLIIFAENKINISHIESRYSKPNKEEHEVLVELETEYGNMGGAIKELQEVTGGRMKVVLNHSGGSNKWNPWFPRKIQDLDTFPAHVLSYGDELDADHPGFKDPIYRARRQELANMAANYKHGEPISRVEYTFEETETWGKVFRKLTALHPTHACREYNDNFPIMVERCGYREDNIPQLQDVSEFLKEHTGFTLRPVAGYLCWRDFLAGLAFRVFHATQYIRHSSRPFHTPEPDICHELLGHLPLFADPEFAHFAHELGLASLGASHEDIKRLSACLWFTIEIGLCRQDGQLKAFGGALLSSSEELEYCLSDKPELRPFDPSVTGSQEYSITEFQPVFYVAESFRDAKDKLMEHATTIRRPFKIHYHAQSSSVEILDPRN